MSDCQVCHGARWVCEDHPDRPYGTADGCDCGGTKRAAIELKAKRTIEKLEGRKLPGKLKFTAGARFAELCADAQAESSLHNGDSSQGNLRTIVDALAPDFGNRLAETITTDELKKWLVRERNQRGWEDGTYNHYVTQLRLIYRLGAHNKKVSVNPAADLKKFHLDNDRPRYLTDSEAQRLEGVLRERWPQHLEAVLFAKNTGLRAGAQFGLRWYQIDMHERTLTLPRKSKSKYKKRSWILPLNAIAHGILQRRQSSRAAGKDDFVFDEYHAGPAYLSIPAQWFPPIVGAAELKDFTWHSLRHDFASQLVMRGVNLKTVQMLMCHSTLKQTAKYADLAPDHLREAADTLIGPKPSATRTATGLTEFQLSA